MREPSILPRPVSCPWPSAWLLGLSSILRSLIRRIAPPSVRVREVGNELRLNNAALVTGQCIEFPSLGVIDHKHVMDPKWPRAELFDFDEDDRV